MESFTGGRFSILIICCMAFMLECALVPTPDTKVSSTTVTPVKPIGKKCSDSKQNSEPGGVINYNPNSVANCSDDDILIKESEPSRIEVWKTNVIITCTVTAAIEVVIVVIIVLYWKQIRWSLRKIKCPCDESQRNRGRSSQHNPLERATTESQRHSNRNQSNPSRQQNNQSDVNFELVDPHIHHSSLFTEGPGTSSAVPENSNDVVEQTYVHVTANIPDSIEHTAEV